MPHGMFDAVVIATADPEPAARSFATLVEGVVDGLVRRVTLLSPHDSGDLRRLGDAAGCRMALGVSPGGFGEALQANAETPHVIALAAGALLPPGWPDMLRREFERRGAPPPHAGLAFRPDALAARLRVMAALAGRRRLPLGWGALAPRASLTSRGFDGVAVETGAQWAMAQVTVARAGGWQLRRSPPRPQAAAGCPPPATGDDRRR